MVKLFLHFEKEQGSIHQITNLTVESKANLGFAVFVFDFWHIRERDILSLW